MHINLSSSKVEDAGEVSSEGNITMLGNGISNPVVKDGVTTWDCVYFGSYRQNCTFKKQDIEWRVLSVDGDDAFLLADRNLDCKPYNEKYEYVTWETCTLRKWLNEDFYNEAFDADEKKAVMETTVVTENNPGSDIEGGNDTKDKVYLLSIAEALNAAYGFGTRHIDSIIRYARFTDYAKLKNGNTYVCWWLRSPGAYSVGAYSIMAANVLSGGVVDSFGDCVDNGNDGVRPVLHINLSSSTWSKVGKVSSSLQGGGETNTGLAKLFQSPSTRYSNDLALMAAEMSEKAEEGEDAIRELYDSYGLTDCEYENFSFMDWKSAAYAIGQSTLTINGSDTTVLVITARGTKNLVEGIGDIFKGPITGKEVDFLGTKVWINVHDFYETIWNGVRDYIYRHPDLRTEEHLKILINGHSLGGAAANMLGAMLTNGNGMDGGIQWIRVEKEDIYVYTFGAIKVLTEENKYKNISSGYENIHNIYNYYDSYGPNGCQSWTNAGAVKAKFGHTEIYSSKDTRDDPPNMPWLTCYSHQMSNYKKALEENKVTCSAEKMIQRKERLTKLKENVWQSNGKIISEIAVLCPVDVEIYTSDGRLAGSVINDTSGETIQDKVYVCVEGDKKYIYLLDDDSYTIRLKGTSEGTMEYSVQNVDIDTGEEEGERIFANVKLAVDKHFISLVKVEESRITGIETGEISLYVTDSNGTIRKEVLADGSGTEVTVDEKTEKPENPKGQGTDSTTETPGGLGSGSKNPNEKNPSVKVKKIKISGSSAKIAAGKKITLKAVVSPSNAANKSVKWKSGNKKYATVNSRGVVTLKKAGGGKTVTITASAKDGSGKKASYRIKIMKGIVKKVGISGKTARTVKAGVSVKLKATVKASNGANKTLQWKSSNTGYATVNGKGKVTLKKAGKGKTVKITAMATDGSGKKAVVKIKIK